MSYTLIHNQDAHQYEYHIDNHICYITYDDQNGKMHLTHTVVPKALGGQGIAKKLLIDVLKEIRKTGKKAVAECSYVVNFEAKNPDFSDVFTK